MLLPLLLLVETSDVVATFRAATRAETPCPKAQTSAEILVCGRREADKRYRITFVMPDARDNVPAERADLLADKIDHCGRQLMFTDCGMVGVAMTAGAGGVRVKTRKLAD